MWLGSSVQAEPYRISTNLIVTVTAQLNPPICLRLNKTWKSEGQPQMTRVEIKDCISRKSKSGERWEKASQHWGEGARNPQNLGKSFNCPPRSSDHSEFTIEFIGIRDRTPPATVTFLSVVWSTADTAHHKAPPSCSLSAPNKLKACHVSHAWSVFFLLWESSWSIPHEFKSLKTDLGADFFVS